MSDDKEKYAGLIRQLIPVNELPPQIQNEFINKAELLSIRKRKFIFNQGDRDEYSFYLLEGEIEFYADKHLQSEIKGATDRAKYAMAQLQPRQFSAKAKSNCVVLRILRNSVDQLLVLQGQSSGGDEDGLRSDNVDVTTVDFSEDEGVDWMTRMFQSELFSRLPTANIHALFALLTPLELKTGDVVVKQGEPGECYYIIQEGQLQVSRIPPSGGKEVNLAVLHPGDSFGEEALIADTTRNATVSMLTDGIVMELSKDDFINLVKKPALQSVSYGEAVGLIEAGNYRWLDVRFKKEHEDSAIEGSINIPLNILRMQMEKLDREVNYIVYCDTSGRSSTGAFLLTEQGFNACFLEGGLVNCPQISTSPVSAPADQKQPPPKEAGKEPVPEKPEAEEQEEDLDPDVQSSILEAELARTNMEIEEVEKARLETKNKSEQEMQEEIERRLKGERAKIEEAKKAADIESKKLKEREEAKFKKMQEQGAKRLKAEKERLEKVYSRNAEEMEKLQKMKEDATKQLNAERAKLEKQAEESRKQLEEAERLKKELEESKRNREAEALKRAEEQKEEAQKKLEEAESLKMEMEESRRKLEEETERKIQEQNEEANKKIAEAEKIKLELEQARENLEKEREKKEKEQEEQARAIQAKAKAKLEAERKKLAEEYAKTQEELELARKERAAAEAARRAAKDEAAKIIEEFKQKHEKDRELEEEKIKQERLKLEEEQRKIQQSMEEINKSREEAEVAKRKALEEMEELKARQAEQLASADKAAQKAMEKELKVAEDKVNEANKEIAQVEKAANEADAANKLNKEDLMKQLVIEEEVRKQLEEDLQDFREEHEEKEKDFVNISSQMEQMKRIKEKAMAAKQAAKQKNVDMLSEIEAQLGSEDG